MSTITLPYVPHANQITLHEDPHRFKVVVCGRRFGKSTFALNHTLNKALQKEGRYWIVAPSYKQAKSIYWRDHVRQWIPDEIVKKKNESELYVELVNGSIIELKGADNDDALRGAGLDGLVLDEFADMKPQIWSEILRHTLTDKQGWAIFIGTPRGFNHFYELFVKDDPQYAKFQFRTHDNPLIAESELVALEQEYKDQGSDAYLQEVLAEFRKPTGVVFGEFDRSRVRKVDYNPDLPLYLAWDFGVRDPTVMLWFQRTPGGELYLVDEYEGTDANLDHYLQVLNSKPYKVAAMHCGDPAGFQKEFGTGVSTADLLRKHGIYLKARPGLDKQTLIRAAHGVLPRLYVAERCKRFLMAIEHYHYPREKPNAIKTTTETPVHDWSSHMMDALQYFAVNEPGYGASSIDRQVLQRMAVDRNKEDWL